MTTQNTDPALDEFRARVLAIAEAIATAKEIPSGHLYAAVMSKMTLDQYHACIAVLVRGNLVREQYHVLTWIGKAVN